MTGNHGNAPVIIGIDLAHLSRIGAFFFMCLNQVFSNMSAVDLFIRKKALFMLALCLYYFQYFDMHTHTHTHSHSLQS